MTEPEAQLFQGAAKILGEPLRDSQSQALIRYMDLIVEWNRVHRLVGSSERAWLVKNVLLDSLLFLRVLPPSIATLLDIGSGAGVPGIPIKIARPGVSLVMVESRRKRASFLGAAGRALGLSGVRVVHGRAEDLLRQGERFDAVVARCAGELDAMLDLGSSLVTSTGVVVLAGGPGTGEVPGASSVQIVNPATGAARSFVVRQHASGGDAPTAVK